MAPLQVTAFSTPHIKFVGLDEESKDCVIYPGVFNILLSGHEEIRRMPVCVLCVMGASRSGKSFFLNFVLRYLNASPSGRTGSSEGYPYPKWIDEGGSYINGFRKFTKGEEITRGDDGFCFSPGRNATTKGILFWDTPFILHGEDGIDRCLLIMDTQGLWDLNTFDSFNHCIFGLSAFLASYLIFNCKGCLNMEQLKNLSTLSKFSCGLANHSKAFQHLDLLIRDFPDYDTDTDGIQEAIEYSKNQLEELRNSKHLEKERDAICSCFEECGVFCLPNPGDIAGMNYNGSISTVRHMFLRILSHRIDEVINSIQPRKFNGEELTVEAFIDFALRCGELFKKQDTFPDSSNVLDAMNYSINIKIKSDSVSLFLSSLEQQVNGDKPIEDTVLTELLENMTKQALAHYDAQAKGSEEVKSDTRSQLLAILNSEATRIKCENKQRLIAEWENAENSSDKLKTVDPDEMKLQRINAIFDRIAVEEFHEAIGEAILRMIQSWREYSASGNTMVEELTYSRNIINEMKKAIQKDTEQSQEDTEEVNKKTKKKRFKVSLLGLGSISSLLVNPSVGLAAATTAGSEALTMNDELKAQKKRNRIIVERNSKFIKELDDILRLLLSVCFNH